MNQDPPRRVFLRLTINPRYGHYGAMRALREFRGLPAILEAQGTEAADRCMAWRSETLPTRPSPHPIMGISRHAHYQCNQSRAGTLAWQGFPRSRTKNYLGYLFPMGHHENRISHAGRGLVDGYALGRKTAMLGRLPMPHRMLVTCWTKAKGLHRCKPLFCMVRHQESN